MSEVSVARFMTLSASVTALDSHQSHRVLATNLLAG